MYYKLKTYIIILLLPMISSIEIPTSFKNKTDVIKNIISPNFFKLRIKHLEISKYNININLDDNINNIKWPVKLVYVKTHNMYQLPNVLSPSLKTTEIWNYESEYITAFIETCIVKLKLIIKPVQNKNLIYIQIIPKITNKQFFVPYSNQMIEDNVAMQCKIVFNKIVKELEYYDN